MGLIRTGEVQSDSIGIEDEDAVIPERGLPCPSSGGFVAVLEEPSGVIAPG